MPPGEQDALITAAAAALQPGEGARLRRPLVGLVRHAPAEAAAQVAVEAAALRAQWQAALATSEAGPACLDGGPPPIARVLGEHAHPRLAAIVVGDHATRAAALRWAERAQPALAERIVLDAPAPFAAHDVDAAIDAALAPCVPLASGAALIFEAGETLTAIDVDTAQHLGRAGWTARDVGHEAVPEIARQLRLRSIGGAIVIDLLKSSRGGDREGVLRALRAALAGDPARCHVLGVSHLGLVELTRQRRGPTLAATEHRNASLLHRGHEPRSKPVPIRLIRDR